ncbi:unnamed protein product [Didymodactylos carnosus]|uniref:GEVED domain-containing protein n=1 Tax=Didymodactylos carnosus TaxID=1234261 RepID=A0A815EVU4_9BILA|nr:unnamed protein product [Didymodactylos carnosus]CAF1473601.1 unnamed protein product [Didymodactylos carnosus]CAF4160730.1 unnamed protein product [Didymodactylos carnosus]CAF4264947.1 unnamed protein product [Didymodactylos carnosus]
MVGPCIPQRSNCADCGSSCDTINDFILPGDAGTAINDIGTGCVGFSGYDDRTNESLCLSHNTYNLTVSCNYPSSELFSVWIDFNKNGVFETTTEQIISNYGGITTSRTTIPFTIPGNVQAGVYTMRAVVAFAGGNPDPCIATGFIQDGETHDYTVVITNAN